MSAVFEFALLRKSLLLVLLLLCVCVCVCVCVCMYIAGMT